MSNLATLLKSSGDSAPDGDKLLDLYWNRNELKKAFAELKDENFRLREKIQQQDGAVARIEQKLTHIEELLVDPEWAPSILVHYQLKGVGQRLTRKLARFAEQLKVTRERKMRDDVLGSWRAGIDAERDALERQLAQHEASIISLDDQRRSENRRLADTNSLLRPFRTRTINNRIDELSEQILAEEQGKSGLEHELQVLAERQPPENEGLNVAAKRSINCMILAFAQQLYLQFGDDDLVGMVKEAGDKSAGAVQYGDKGDCEHVLDRLSRSTSQLEKNGESPDQLKRRAVLLHDAAQFASEDDAVPFSGSVATLYRLGEDGTVTQGSADLLGDNYWGVIDVLSG